MHGLDLSRYSCCMMQAMLQWWRQWVVYKQQQQELLESSCCHMEAYSAQRCGKLWACVAGGGGGEGHYPLCYHDKEVELIHRRTEAH